MVGMLDFKLQILHFLTLDFYSIIHLLNMVHADRQLCDYASPLYVVLSVSSPFVPILFMYHQLLHLTSFL